jgi:tetratricopeptide (TPR) repeat protein
VKEKSGKANRRSAKGVVACVLLVCAGLICVGVGQDAKYHEQTRKSYDFRFGENPWLPSQAQSATGRFLSPSQFPSAEFCSRCHAETHRQWRESAHSNAFRAPFYKRNVDLLIEAKGIEFTRHCEGCHNPVALFTGVLTAGSKTPRPFDEEGVSCMVCHSIQKVASTSGTGSYVMGVPAVMVDDKDNPVTGPVTQDDILTRPKLHARAVMKDFYRTSEFCSACHKAAIPRLLNDYKWLRVFNVYDEWQASSDAKQSPLPFYEKAQVSTCQTCHMQPVEAREDYGAKQGKVASHRWLGANTAIPQFYNFDEQLQKTIEFLQRDLLGVDIFALRREEKGEWIAPLGKQAFQLAAGDKVTLEVVIQNKGIGHSLVPEQRDFYEAWVEFQVSDAAGKTIAHSGYLQPDQYLDPKAHSYTNRLISKEGDLLDQHEVWQIRTRAFDQTILPGRSDLVRYQFRVPELAQGPLKVAVAVNYRRFRQGWLEYALNQKGAKYPVVKMAGKSVTLNLGENVAQGAPGEADALRWNNYGISLLGQQQYAQAVAAFAKVVELKPLYVPGYINLAVAHYSYEKYEPALRMLEKALAMQPGNARALFYKASVLRIQGHLAEAAELYRKVLAQYPRFGQAHSMLGFIYYQQKKYALARQSYEALQQIDPDDLSAHYNLMLIYRRSGLKEKAVEQAAYFADRKDDPGASAYALEFLRRNPQIASESVPWHVHAATAAGAEKP